MADIYVYGAIGDDWSEDCTTAKNFADKLAEAKGEDVTIHINSAGGNVFDANTMSELVRSYGGKTTASIEGLAASAASYFALTADEVVMNPSALLMIHNPYACCMGDAEQMRKTAGMLDKVKSTITGQYVRKTGKDEAEVAKLMDAETWMTAKEAYEGGFVDRLTDDEPVAAMLTEDELRSFHNAPSGLSAKDGDERQNICAASSAEGSGAGAAKEGTEAVHRTVCINGQFLKY